MNFLAVELTRLFDGGEESRAIIPAGRVKIPVETTKENSFRQKKEKFVFLLSSFLGCRARRKAFLFIFSCSDPSITDSRDPRENAKQKLHRKIPIILSSSPREAVSLQLPSEFYVQCARRLESCLCFG